MYEKTSKSYIVTDDMSDHLPCIISMEDLNKYECVNMVSKCKINEKKIGKIRHDLSNKDWNKILQ